MTREWMWTPTRAMELDYASLPPDWTYGLAGARCISWIDVPELHECSNACGWLADCPPDGYKCTRLDGHRGRHAAGNRDRIVAVWARDQLDDVLAAAARQITALVREVAP